jgi:hypothetical protein
VLAGRVQLLGDRRALGAVQAEGEVQRIAHVVLDRARQAGGAEVARGADRFGRVDFDVDPVVARAQLQLERTELALADPEHAGVAATAGGHEGLLADRVEIAARQLQAEGPVPAGPGAVAQFQPALGAVIVEHGADLVALEFGMGVPGARELHPRRFEGAEVVQSAADLAAALVHDDPHVLVAVLVVVVLFVLVVAVLVVFLVVAVTRHAVAGVEHAPGAAEEAALADEGQAQRGGIRAHEAVGQAAEDLVLVLFRILVVVLVLLLAVQFRKARDPVVAGLAVQRVEMEHQVAVGRGAVEPDHAGALVVDGAAAQFGAALERLVGALLGHAAVDHVDRAADRAAAIQQRRRPLQHLDLVGQERLDAHRVVDAHGRYVAGGQAVAEHLHPGAVQAAHDRPADAGPEVGGLHARQKLDGLAQRIGLGFVQAGAREHLDRARQVLGRLGQGTGTDHHALQVHRLVVAGVALGRILRPGQRCQEQAGDGESQGRAARGGAWSGHAGLG